MKAASRDRVKRRIAPVWKFLGIAGLVSVAAGGVLVARDERARRAYTPDQVRERLHERATEGRTDGDQS